MSYAPSSAPSSTRRSARTRQRLLAIPFLTLIGLLGLSLAPGGTAVASAPLRDHADAQGVIIGAAVATGPLSGESQYRQILAREFNSVTAENAMKWSVTEPSPGQFDFSGADAIVNFAQANNQAIHGHTLVWHNQTPSWVQNLSAPEMDAAMQRHIETVAGRYAGQIGSWDVVNEAFNSDGSLRNSFWLQTLGRDYIANAFRYANAADPNADLYINDYSVEGINAKSTAMYNLVQDLLAQGVPIDGVGFQAHLGIQYGFPSSLQQNIQRFANLGLEVRITELDVRMQLPVTQAKLQEQADYYRRVVEACLAVPACEGVTTWGFTDKHSWVPDTFEGQGAALPYDENYNPKPAYDAIHAALGGEPPDNGEPPGGDGTCLVDYNIQNQWNSGFTGQVAITNTGPAVNGWQLAFAFPSGQQLRNGWKADWSQSGQDVTATNLSWNANVSSGETITVGFNAGHTGANREPTAFTLNGVPCDVS